MFKKFTSEQLGRIYTDEDIEDTFNFRNDRITDSDSERRFGTKQEWDSLSRDEKLLKIKGNALPMEISLSAYLYLSQRIPHKRSLDKYPEDVQREMVAEMKRRDTDEDYRVYIGLEPEPVEEEVIDVFEPEPIEEEIIEIPSLEPELVTRVTRSTRSSIPVGPSTVSPTKSEQLFHKFISENENKRPEIFVNYIHQNFPYTKDLKYREGLDPKEIVGALSRFRQYTPRGYFSVVSGIYEDADYEIVMKYYFKAIGLDYQGNEETDDSLENASREYLEYRVIKDLFLPTEYLEKVEYLDDEDIRSFLLKIEEVGDSDAYRINIQLKLEPETDMARKMLYDSRVLRTRFYNIVK